MKTQILFATLAAVALAAPADEHKCPAPGSTDSQGRYSCNPAHQYPNGQTCEVVDGCYYLFANGKPVDNSGSSTVTSAQPTQSATCPAPGSTDAQGRYSCNPAHQYPNGQTCNVIDGCYYLCDASGKPVINTVTATVTSAQPTQSSACPAPGSTDDKGRYSCNPAHQYPNGQTCNVIDGCYYLCGSDGKPISNVASSTAAPTQTPTCPAPGSTDSQGRYSCNPAHQYPNGQTCQVIDGCYYLCGSDGKPIPNTVSSTAAPTQTPTCPAPGSTDSKGRYSCNPAHQYPNGQTCQVIDGCYFLCGSDGKPIDNNPPTAQPTKSSPSATVVNPTRTGVPTITAGAAHVKGAGMLVLAAVGLAL
ncbi:hypothetical protein JDV02_010243 [Purpureocillium takamizusanense]|uniref:Uncharacterized protein n=1 Tax=Purpureocillium takamizusanense TaxID=2060973 RepID=A0A9Q8QRU3_9HYPO|nr:uncharacterized protein JDV02_010243 [Purpureocillium takamizusanense]UNI24503.1 hypothetical protein JDV02_010243 [Purpureocillium takamizusanense]